MIDLLKLLGGFLVGVFRSQSRFYEGVGCEPQTFA
jgi:hypothetical protein